MLGSDIETAIDEALDAAVASWSADGFDRFDDSEANCTVQLYRWIKEATRQHATLDCLSAGIESVQLTPEMLEGKADAGKARRPDIRLSIGSIARTTECKRLAETGVLPGRYVNEGMVRFVDGSYANRDRQGRMVGYVQHGDPVKIVTKINNAVGKHPLMGAGHELQAAPGLGSLQANYESSHVRKNALSPFQLRHHLIEVPPKVP